MKVCIFHKFPAAVKYYFYAVLLCSSLCKIYAFKQQQGYIYFTELYFPAGCKIEYLIYYALKAFYLFNESGKLWIIAFFTDSDNVQDSLQDFDKAVESFKFIGDE